MNSEPLTQSIEGSPRPHVSIEEMLRQVRRELGHDLKIVSGFEDVVLMHGKVFPVVPWDLPPLAKYIMDRL